MQTKNHGWFDAGPFQSKAQHQNNTGAVSCGCHGIYQVNIMCTHPELYFTAATQGKIVHIRFHLRVKYMQILMFKHTFRSR